MALRGMFIFFTIFYTKFSFADVIHVPADQPTIQAGINVATNGDTVLISPGVYNEQLDFGGKDITVASLFLITGNSSHISQTAIMNPAFAMVRFNSGESSFAILNGLTLTGANVAILCYNNSNPTLSNLNISNNTANFLGCGILCEDSSSPYIINCTIANNVLVEPNPHGGGILARNNSHPIIINSIVWNNTTPQISLWHSGGEQPSSITIAHCDIEGGEQGIEIDDGTVNWLQGNIDVDTLFVNAQGGDFTLQLGSPCIDSGTAFFALGNDTLVNLDSTQYIGPAPDMGAFEYGSTSDISSNDLFPKDFLLYQNYPNPFNPTTNIKFTLPKPELVKIEIFNLLGEKIETIINKQMSAGSHEIEFSGQNLPSGVYLYRIEAGKFHDVKKMILIR